MWIICIYIEVDYYPENTWKHKENISLCLVLLFIKCAPDLSGSKRYKPYFTCIITDMVYFTMETNFRRVYFKISNTTNLLVECVYTRNRPLQFTESAACFLLMVNSRWCQINSYFPIVANFQIKPILGNNVYSITDVILGRIKLQNID